MADSLREKMTPRAIRSIGRNLDKRKIWIRGFVLSIAVSTIATGSLAELAENRNNVCTSRECTEIASKISKMMNFRANPCDDFYEYTCGGFIESLPKDSFASYKKIVDVRVEEDIRRMMEADIEPNEPKPFKLVKTFYRSCVDREAIELKGLESFRGMLRDLGGWPVLEGESWDDKSFDWRRPFHKLRGKRRSLFWEDNFTFDNLFHVDIPIYGSSRKITLMRSQCGKSHLADFYNLDSILHRSYVIITSLATKFGADKVRIRDDFYHVSLLEQKLADIDSPNCQLSQWSIRELVKDFPSVPWMTYIQNFLPGSKNITEDEIVDVTDPNYFVQLEAVMSTVSKRVQANYVISGVVLENAIYSTEEIRKTVYPILKTQWIDDERERYCKIMTTTYFWRALIPMYWTKYFNATVQREIIGMYWITQVVLRTQLRKNYSIREKRRQEILERMHRISLVIGHPEKLLNLTVLDALYENLSLIQDDYFENMYALSRYEHELAEKTITRPTEQMTLSGFKRFLDDGFHTAKANYYFNHIVIGAAYLRELYFGADRPKYMNYGSLGSVMGHEMIHFIFENSLSRYSYKYTGLRHRPEFRDHARCLINQYNSLYGNDKTITANSRGTLVETVADIGGIELAYNAYNFYMRRRPMEPKLPGFENYSAKQMFWISYGVHLCKKEKPELMISTNVTHPTSKFRVLQTIANTLKFAEDFRCTRPSLMNPTKRCSIW